MSIIQPFLNYSLIAYILFSSFFPFDVINQEIPGCSEIEVIFYDLSGSAEMRGASIVSDPSGNAHLFWLYKKNLEDPLSWGIYYARWENETWHVSKDVLITPNGSAGEPEVVYSNDGYLHVIWIDKNSVWYSNAHVKNADNPFSWTPPIIIGDNSISASIEVDSKDQLHVIYSDNSSIGALYHTQLSNNGEWMQPISILNNYDVSIAAAHPQFIFDVYDNIYLTWTTQQYPGGWPPLGQWYASSKDFGESWTSLNKIGGENQGQGTITLIGNDEVHIVWRGTSAFGNTYHLWSEDGGINWTGPIIFDSDGGFSGPQSLAFDSLGDLHLVRSDGGYQIWDKSLGWRPVPALYADSGETGTISIGLGSMVHWINSTGPNGDNEDAFIWHRLCQTKAPLDKPEPIPTFIATQTIISDNAILSPSPTVTPNFNINPDYAENNINPLYLGVIVAISVLLGIIVFIKTRNRP